MHNTTRRQQPRNRLARPTDTTAAPAPGVSAGPGPDTARRPRPTLPDARATGRAAAQLRHREPDALHAVMAMVRHPRSLARPGARWRPPSLRLPGFGDDPAAVVAVSRHRVGVRARARIRGYGGESEAVYLVTARFTGPAGPLPAATAETWVRALLADDAADTVHQLTDAAAPTFCWFVDRDYRPVHSPSSLFAADEAA